MEQRVRSSEVQVDYCSFIPVDLLLKLGQKKRRKKRAGIVLCVVVLLDGREQMWSPSPGSSFVAFYCGGGGLETREGRGTEGGRLF